MSKVKKIIAYFVLFLGSFVVFLYMTFPFKVSKEALANEITKMTGVSVRIQDLSPSFPVGLNLAGLTLNNPGGKNLKLDKQTNISWSTIL